MAQIVEFKINKIYIPKSVMNKVVGKRGKEMSCGDCILCPVQSPCLMRNCAELLNAEGNRKASEVAREIFEEIEKLIEPNGNYLWRWDLNELAKLKKKYTESEDTE